MLLALMDFATSTTKRLLKRFFTFRASFVSVRARFQTDRKKCVSVDVERLDYGGKTNSPDSV